MYNECFRNPQSLVGKSGNRKFHKSKWNHQVISPKLCRSTLLPPIGYVRLDWLKPSLKTNADQQRTKKVGRKSSWISADEIGALTMLFVDQTMQPFEFEIVIKNFVITKVGIRVPGIFRIWIILPLDEKLNGWTSKAALMIWNGFNEEFHTISTSHINRINCSPILYVQYLRTV